LKKIHQTLSGKFQSTPHPLLERRVPNSQTLPGNSRRTLLQNFLPEIFKKYFTGPLLKFFSNNPPERKISDKSPLFTPPQTHIFQSSPPLPSGHVSASVPPKFPDKAQTGPRLDEDHPLFDRKLLEELHEQGGVGNDRELTSVSDVRVFGSGPQKGPFFPLDRAIYPAQKGGCCKPAKLQGLNPRKSVRF